MSHYLNQLWPCLLTHLCVTRLPWIKSLETSAVCMWHWSGAPMMQVTTYRLVDIKKHITWRHDERDGVSNHQPRDCLLKRLFGRRSKKTSKLRVTGLCAGNSPVNSPHKGPVTRKMFPFDDVIMTYRGVIGIQTCSIQAVRLGFCRQYLPHELQSHSSTGSCH